MTAFDTGRKNSTSFGISDRQSVRAPQAGERGIDDNKNIVGRKRHVAVDSDGRLLSQPLSLVRL